MRSGLTKFHLRPGVSHGLGCSKACTRSHAAFLGVCFDLAAHRMIYRPRFHYPHYYIFVITRLGGTERRTDRQTATIELVRLQAS